MDPEVLLNEASLLPFTAAEHVGLINSLPTTFGQLNADGMFPEVGLSSPYVRVEIHDGVITALPVTPGGRPSSIARHEPGSGRILEIPNISHEDSVQAVDVRDWQAYAQRTRTPEEMLVNRVEERHRRNRLKFDITLEVMKVSALQGRIVDGAGTLLYNLYSLFGIDERVVYFDFNDDEFDVPGAIEAVIGGTEDALIDEVMDGLEVRCSPEFYNNLIRHPTVQKYFANTPLMQQLLNVQRQQVGGGFRRTIEIGGITFREYRATVKMWGAETPTRLIAAGQGHAFPTGTVDTHKTFVAPPLDIRVLNGSAALVGDELIHMTTEIMKHGMGEEWKYQANPLPLWKRPKLLTKLVTGVDPG